MRTHYAPRHQPGPTGTLDNAGRLQIADPVGPDYSPLRAGVRLALAPDYWAHPDHFLPGGPAERTSQLDVAEILAYSPAAAAPSTVTRDQVLAELFAGLADPAAAAVSLEIDLAVAR